MKASSSSSSMAVLGVVVLLVLAGGARLSEAACNPSELNPCLPAVQQGTPPSAICCTKIKAQQPCLCGYLKDPNLAKFLRSPNAQKVASACHVSIPKC